MPVKDIRIDQLQQALSRQVVAHVSVTWAGRNSVMAGAGGHQGSLGDTKTAARFQGVAGPVAAGIAHSEIGVVNYIVADGVKQVENFIHIRSRVADVFLGILDHQVVFAVDILAGL